MGKTIKSYFDLTKPTIMLLVIVTGGTALVLEGSLLHEPLRFLLVIVAIYLTGGSANALNQCFERKIDAKMKRTAARSPLPTNKISPRAAFILSVLIGLVGLLIFGLFFNWYSALLSLSTILFYSLFYTLYLKPNTSQNIVIGGAAGSMAPVGAWVAASGNMALDPWILFLIIFLWTPPHFWALALVYKDDYRVAQLPMLPVVKGEDSTFKQMIMYSWLLVIASLFLLINQSLGVAYIIAAIVLGGVFLQKVFKASKVRTEKEIKGLFGYSIVYLFLLFTVIVVDGMI